MRSERLKPVERHTQQVEQQAARVYVEARHKVENLQQQLQRMQEYRVEYSQRMKPGHTDGLIAVRLVDHQQFLGKITSAIEQLHTAISDAQQHCEQKQKLWLSCRSRHQAVDKAIDRFVEAERFEARKKEQKESDELTMKKGSNLGSE